MFKKIVIHLTEPICPCDEQRLVWTVKHTEDGSSLAVWCSECKTSMHVPNKEFKASFNLEKPYPGKPVPKSTPRPTPSRGLGDVIDMAEFIRRRREREPLS